MNDPCVLGGIVGDMESLVARYDSCKGSVSVGALLGAIEDAQVRLRNVGQLEANRIVVAAGLASLNWVFRSQQQTFYCETFVPSYELVDGFRPLRYSQNVRKFQDKLTLTKLATNFFVTVGFRSCKSRTVPLACSV